ncbi:hypothetical protein AB28_0838 [Raoultella ornithinolytica 2-156-04_S1_C2]|nr:hypothetical protein AB28_0838 [Raoultella ornithinolytica 2-156-04_S1_C2]
MNRKSGMKHPDFSATRCYQVNSGLKPDKILIMVISRCALRLCVF